MDSWLFVVMTGLLIGAAGNIHCIAMCGPLALLLPIHNKKSSDKILAIFMYNIGRATSYAFMGFCIGLFSNVLFIVGFQQTVSVFAGIVLLIISFTSFFKTTNSTFTKYKFYIQNCLTKQINKLSSFKSFYVFGVFNGLLPCGLVYMAVATAITTGSVINSMLLMLAFGIGTFPLLISLQIFQTTILSSLRSKAKKLLPIVTLFIAILLVIRGLGLEIPYISPFFSITKAGSVGCH
jgi:uncharacterized protein